VPRPPSAARALTRRASVAVAGSALLLSTLPACAAGGLAPSAQSAERLEKAVYAASEGNVAEATRLVNQVIELQPRYAGGLAARASLAVQRGDYPAALSDYDAAIALGPADGEAAAMLLNRGCVLTALSRSADALVDFDAALLLDRGNKLLLLNRALACLDLGRDDEAFKALRQLVTGAGMSVEPYWLVYALLLAQRAPLAEATGVLKRVEARFGAVDDVHAALALTLAREGRLDAAREQWRRVADPAPFRSVERLVRKPKRWPRESAAALQELLPQLEGK
jgi:tetratricopeptide (TPR) repeat protein